MIEPEKEKVHNKHVESKLVPEPEPEMKTEVDKHMLEEHNLDPEVFAQLPENIR